MSTELPKIVAPETVRINFNLIPMLPDSPIQRRVEVELARFHMRQALKRLAYEA